MNMRALYRTHVFFGESFGIESIWRFVCSGVSEHVSDTGTMTVQTESRRARPSRRRALRQCNTDPLTHDVAHDLVKTFHPTPRFDDAQQALTFVLLEA